MIDQSKQIAKESNSSFYYAFSLLAKPKRDAMNTVYAFCRKTDDIVDEGDESEEIKYERLRKWKIELEKHYTADQILIFLINSPRSLNSSTFQLILSLN